MWTVIDEKWCGSVAALSYSLLEYIRKFLYPHIFSHLLSTDELNVLKSRTRILPLESRCLLLFSLPIRGKGREGDNKTENRWMNCWYMTEVGSRLSSNTRMGKDSSMDHGAIVRGIVLLSLSFIPRWRQGAWPKSQILARRFVARFAPWGRRGVNIYLLPHLPSLLESATTMAGPTGNATSGESSCIKSGRSR